MYARGGRQGGARRAQRNAFSDADSYILWVHPSLQGTRIFFFFLFSFSFSVAFCLAAQNLVKWSILHDKNRLQHQSDVTKVYS